MVSIGFYIRTTVPATVVQADAIAAGMVVFANGQLPQILLGAAMAVAPTYDNMLTDMLNGILFGPQFNMYGVYLLVASEILITLALGGTNELGAVIPAIPGNPVLTMVQTVDRMDAYNVLLTAAINGARGGFGPLGGFPVGGILVDIMADDAFNTGAMLLAQLNAFQAAFTAAVQGLVAVIPVIPTQNVMYPIVAMNTFNAYNGQNNLFGYNFLPMIDDVLLPTIHTAGNAFNADFTSNLFFNVGGTTEITNVCAVQTNPLDVNLNPVVADNIKSEAWLRKLTAKYLGNKDTTFFKENISKYMSEFYGVGLNNERNTEARFAGMNVAFIVGRINLYDQWSDNGPMSVEKKTSEQSIFDGRGLLVQFNQLLAAYIGTFIEPGTKKFYSPLVDGLINSKISDAITSGNAIADINIFDANDVGIPPEGSILCASIARAIRILLYKKVENSRDNLHATNSLLEVAGFMRENMKGNLPHFAKMFNQLADVASMYKKILLDNPTVKYERKTPVVPIPFNENAVKESERLLSNGQREYIDPNKQVSENDIIRYYRVLLDNIEMGCNSTVRCISQVYKELNDVPLFGETYSGSLLDFKQKSGKYPLALPSIVQALLHHKVYNKGVGLPAAKHGSEAFKMLFMSRRVLTEASSVKIQGGGNMIDYMPGLVETINNYNAISIEQSKLPKALIESCIKANMDLINILVDLKVRGSWSLDPNSA